MPKENNKIKQLDLAPKLELGKILAREGNEITSEISDEGSQKASTLAFHGFCTLLYRFFDHWDGQE